MFFFCSTSVSFLEKLSSVPSMCTNVTKYLRNSLFPEAEVCAAPLGKNIYFIFRNFTLF
jgi:hypothetical protein